MKYFQDFNKGLQLKLTLSFLLFSMIPIVAGIIFTVINIKEQTEKLTKEQLQQVVSFKKELVKQQFDNVYLNLVQLSEDITIINAINNLTTSWKSINRNNDATTYLQNAYIESNPNPIGQKYKLFNANDGSSYSAFHEEYHDYFLHVQEIQKYYDIFLFDLEGNMIYSFFKENDYAHNFLNGSFATTGLGEAFQKAIRLKEKEVGFVDFKPYAPSNNAPASFMAIPVFTKSERIGTLAVQVSIDRVEQSIQTNSAENPHTDSFLMGSDGTLRTPGTKNASVYNLFTSFDDPAIKEALETKAFARVATNETGIVEQTNYIGEEVYSAYSPISIYGVTWFIFSELELSIALENVRYYTKLFMLMGLLLLILIALGSIILSAIVGQPLKDAINRFNTNFKEIISVILGIRSSSSDLSHEASRQAATTEEISASISEISSKSQQNKEMADNALNQAKNLALTSNQAFESLERLVESVSSVKNGADRSSEIIKSIDQIAFQTNLLALNAAVEAARAGEAGAGFAVVAEEVRSLALSSSRAAKEIEEIIKHTVETSEQTQVRLKEFESFFEQIRKASQQISHLNTTIQELTEQEKNAIDQIRMGMQESEKGAQTIAMSTDNLISSSELINDEIQEIESTIISFRKIILGKVASA